MVPMAAEAQLLRDSERRQSLILGALESVEMLLASEQDLTMRMWLTWLFLRPREEEQDSCLVIIQGVPRLLSQLSEALISVYVDGIQYHINHLIPTLGDFV